MKRIILILCLLSCVGVAYSQQLSIPYKGTGFYPYKVLVSSWSVQPPSSTSYTAAKALYAADQDISNIIACDIMAYNAGTSDVYLSSGVGVYASSKYVGLLKAGESLTLQGYAPNAVIAGYTLNETSNMTTIYMYLTGKSK